ncbi:hypothetical protein BGW36DRAFT_383005 [Talaromyces proteolyticus]|uniref:Indoleamine 2,3-dioxygenase n=1 Tax=Talaromyces proteolyticus TaxID=1131652 RepID=A0AAD4KPZ8_9EURO|nr:uncharacterized protein BGW36DRAFT_383005 [Talaromyces proteolyticus]KAH8695603.1 hypothetical protein BGW36DRAFT_383005 [Talaromyces proteolyticus]
MPEVIRSAEYHFGHIFPAMEKEGVPIYYHMVTAILSFEREDRRQSLKHLRSINEHIKPTLKIFFDSLVDSRISKKYWMRYVQGIQGWAAGNIVEGKYIEYDGLSGNQLLLLHCIDSFIGLEPYLPTENTLRYIPHLQRELSKSFSQHNFRRMAEKVNDTAIIAELDTIAKQLRLFRAAHRSRATPYLSVPAPERLIMTAGKSVLESDTVQNIKAAIDILDAMLLKRFQQTR